MKCFPRWHRLNLRTQDPSVGGRVPYGRRRTMSRDDPRQASVTEGPPSPWINKHQNVSQDFEMFYSVANPPSPVTNFFGDLQLTVAALQRLIADAIRDNV